MRRARPSPAVVVVLAIGLALPAVGCGQGTSDPGSGTSPRSASMAITTAATSATGSDTTATGGGAVVPLPTTGTSAGRGDWVTYHHDAARTGVDQSSPAAGAVAEAWRSATLDGTVYAEPLVVGGEVIVATENDTVHALDVATGAVRWTRHLGTPVAGDSLPCGNIDPSGITGTPVADPTHATLWVVTFEQPAHHQLYALNLTDGSIRSSRAADPPGADATVQQQRGALSSANDMVYIPYGGLFGDCGHYLGRVVGVPASGDAVGVSFTVPNEERAGIWAPPGATVAADGSLYVATGNGASSDAFDDANAVVHLSPALMQLDAFAPQDWADMNDRDLDLGTVGPSLLADGSVLQVDKQGIGYLLDGAHLGGVGGAVFQSKVCDSAYGATAVHGSTVVVPCRDGVHAVQIVGGSSPRFSVQWSAGDSRAGPPIVAGGLVWSVNGSGHLQGIVEATGGLRFDFTVGDVVTSFPSLAAAEGRLFVPAGDRLVAYQGV